jgi:hypothetical protein
MHGRAEGPSTPGPFALRHARPYLVPGCTATMADGSALPAGHQIGPTRSVLPAALPAYRANRYALDTGMVRPAGGPGVSGTVTCRIPLL